MGKIIVRRHKGTVVPISQAKMCAQGAGSDRGITPITRMKFSFPGDGWPSSDGNDLQQLGVLSYIREIREPGRAHSCFDKQYFGGKLSARRPECFHPGLLGAKTCSGGVWQPGGGALAAASLFFRQERKD